MSDFLQDLYQEIIMDHSRSPRNFGKPACYQAAKESFNPLCGDRLTLFITKDQQKIQMAFEGAGCSMCMASASLLLENLQHKTADDAQLCLQALFALLRSESLSDDQTKRLGKLVVLGSVKRYPSRVKCVTLSWHALSDLLETIGLDS